MYTQTLLQSTRSHRARHHFSDRSHRKGILLYQRSKLFIFSLLLHTSYLCASCTTQLDSAPPEPVPLPGPEEVQDSICFAVKLDSSALPIRSLDILIYEDSGIKPLLEHRRLDSEFLPELEFKLPEGEKRVVAIANSRKPLSLASLSRYDGAKELSFVFGDDDRDYPLMSAETSSCDSCIYLNLRELRGYVHLSSISNGLDDYELLEEPRVRLRNINNSAKILLQDGFHPTELLDYGAWVPLPHDVGLNPLHTDIVMCCFPNSTDESYSSSSTQLELECIVLGDVCRYKINLPAIERSDTVRVELSVAGRYDYSSRIWSSTSQTQLSEDLVLKPQAPR